MENQPVLDPELVKTVQTVFPEGTQRKVACSAVRYPDGTMLIGVRHFDNLMQAQYHKFKPEGDDEQGFVDQRGVFMNRKEALIVAVAANQLIRKTNPLNKLFSEDYI